MPNTPLDGRPFSALTQVNDLRGTDFVPLYRPTEALPDDQNVIISGERLTEILGAPTTSPDPGSGTGGTTTLVAPFPVTSSGAFTAILPTGATRALHVWVKSPSAYGYEPETRSINDTIWAYNAFTRALTIPAYHLASGDTVTVLYGTGASGGGSNAVIQLS